MTAKFTRRIVTTVFALGIFVSSASAFAATTHRPISDFLDTQGTFCVDPPTCTIFVPPVPNFVAFTDTKRNLGISFDYAGLSDDPVALNGQLGTTFSGDISERTLQDGSVVVTVHLRTSNALVYVIPFDFSRPGDNQFGENDLIFGTRATDVLAGAEPALGDSNFTLEFTNTAPGLPIPDFEEFLFGAPVAGRDILSLTFNGTATGHFADGTPGKVQVTQKAILHNGFHGKVGDGFPVENIILIQQ